MVLGIIALIGGLTGWAGVVCGILAIVFGAVGRKDKAHKTMATWGLVLGVIALFGGLIIALLIGGAIFGAVAAAL
ncbi:MAG: hypothetical protein SOT81_09040 [Treponema sp.]|nr:hypothetical protein [Treponema sp.]